MFVQAGSVIFSGWPKRYVASLQRGLQENGIDPRGAWMQFNGGNQLGRPLLGCCEDGRAVMIIHRAA
jgi:hypothetical protein